MVVGHAQVINNYDAAPADTNYWAWYEPVQEGNTTSGFSGHYAISTSADSSLGWIQTSYVTDTVLEGEGAMRIDYSVQNAEGWGGYSKLQHYHPDPDARVTYDWSLYDSISFSYNNIVAQDAAGSVHLRLNLCDYGSITDSAYGGLGEFYYSFNYILDDVAGWNTITIPLISNGAWGTGEGFNHTGWSGDAGNDVFDLDKIGGFALEFSIGGGGEGNVTTGSIILDDFKLTGSRNELENPGFELADTQDEGFGWGASAADGATAGIVEDAAVARTGTHYAKLSTTGDAQWAVLYAENNAVASSGETWEFSAWIKDISAVYTEGSSAHLKFEYNGMGNDYANEINIPGVTTEWQRYSIVVVPPSDVTSIKAVIVSQTWGGPPGDYAFDDLALVNLGNVDSDPPVAVTGLDALTQTNYTSIFWVDNDGEEGETYTVYASRFPITNLADPLSDPNVDVVASGVLETTQAATHRLYAPLDDESQTWYYAVSCTDASLNVGPAGDLGVAVTNTALGVPTIHFGTPANFVADGDVSEWDDAGIVPFEMSSEANSYGTPKIGAGVFTGADDLTGTLWLAMDADYLYVAADVIDNVHAGYLGTGSWWEYDVLELFIGLYNQRGAKHTVKRRGAEPDYKLTFYDGTFERNEPATVTLGTSGDGVYSFGDFNPNYALEAKISLDSLAIANGNEDTRFVPEEGMRITFEPTFHDRDSDSEYNNTIVLSPTNNDAANGNGQVWSHTWIGDLDAVSVDDVTVPVTYMLGNNYPNPFNPSTTINYALGHAGEVRLTIYNVLGQEVQTLVNEVQTAGSHQIHFDASALASGIYLYRLETEGFTATNKMILMK